jgi:hypothetical protein
LQKGADSTEDLQILLAQVDRMKDLIDQARTSIQKGEDVFFE